MASGTNTKEQQPWSAEAVAICIPVRNEAALLPLLLDALARQNTGIATAIAIVFDNCHDDSEHVVALRTAKLPFKLVTSHLSRDDRPNAGRARRAALALGQSAIRGFQRAALLTTDADSRPADDWASANLHALTLAEIATGRIIRDAVHDDPAQDRLEHYYDALFAFRRMIDPVPWEAPQTHHCTGGASLAFRADAYDRLGGFDERPAGEDAAMIDAAHRAGLRVRRDRSIVVQTSSRRNGRALGGLADHLATLDAGPATDAIRVGHPADAAWQYAGHAAARLAFARIADEQAQAMLARQIGVSVQQIDEIARTRPNAEAFAMRIVPGAPGCERLISLDDAERALQTLVTTRQDQAA